MVQIDLGHSQENPLELVEHLGDSLLERWQKLGGKPGVTLQPAVVSWAWVWEWNGAGPITTP